MANANASTKAEKKTQVRTCPCGNEISSGDTHPMCVMCLSLKHAQAAFESTEECTHCERFSLKVLRRCLARQMNLSDSDPVLASTSEASELIDMAVATAPEPEAGPSWGSQLSLTGPFSQELDGPGLAAGPLDFLVERVEDDSDGGSELLMTDEDDDDDSSLGLSGRVAKLQPSTTAVAGDGSSSHLSPPPESIPVITGARTPIQSGSFPVQPDRLLIAYQAELEEEMTASSYPVLLEEMCVITDHCLHLHKVAIQSQGRAMGLMVLQERARWLNLTTLSVKEKEDLLDTPISPKGLFGAAVTSMQKRCEERKREDEALKLCLPRREPTATLPAHRQTFAQAVARPPPTFKIPKLPKSQAAPQAPPRAQAPMGLWQKKSSSQEGTLLNRPPPTFTHGVRRRKRQA